MSNYTNLQWMTRHKSGDEISPAQVGGDVQIFTASGTLNIGDIVYLSAANTVAKSVTPANYAAFMGVVVGGDSIQGFIANDEALAGATALVAALTTKKVLVQVNGIAYCISNGITFGVAVTVDAGTAGRISITGATAGQIIGTTIDAATAGNKQKVLIAPR